MTMTEIEARGKIKYRIANEIRKAGENKEEYEDLEIALQVMKEIREYRELGTVEELKALKEKEERFDRNIKMFNEIGLEIRNNAIDEFVSLLSIRISEVFIWDILITMNKNSSLSDTSDEIVEYVIETSKKIAEKMKGGATDERT